MSAHFSPPEDAIHAYPIRVIALRVADAAAAKAAEKAADPIHAAARAATARRRFIQCVAAGLGIEPEAVAE